MLAHRPFFVFYDVVGLDFKSSCFLVSVFLDEIQFALHSMIRKVQDTKPVISPQ